MANVADKLEVRSNGIPAQLRGQVGDQHRDVLSDPSEVTVNVAHGPTNFEIVLNLQSTFGEVKKAIEQKIGLDCKHQKILFRGLEKEDGESLQESGVRDKAKILLLEIPSNSKNPVVEEGVEQNRDIESDNLKDEAAMDERMCKALIAIDRIREQVDILGDRVVALQVTIDGGTKVADEELAMPGELLMVQLLNLDAIEAEGEAKLQRKAEVLRIQKYHELLDELKGKQSNPFIDCKSDSLSSSVRDADDWDTFD